MITARCFSIEKCLILSGWNCLENNFILWDFREKRLLTNLSGHEGNVTCVDMTADGLNAIPGDVFGKVRYWDLENYREEVLFGRHNG